MRIAVIPARGGSQRIPRKNIREFCGQPIIAWPIQAALESSCFDRVIVSTDDDEIAEIALRYGAEVPFMRPEELADGHTGTRAVTRHAAEWFNAHVGTLDTVACIYATAAFVQPEDLQRASKVLNAAPDLDRVMSVTTFPSPIQRAFRIAPDGTLEMMQPEHSYTRSQDLEEAYHDAAQFYLWRASALLSLDAAAPKSGPLLLPRLRVQDIDTPEDWETAEVLFRMIK